MVYLLVSVSLFSSVLQSQSLLQEFIDYVKVSLLPGFEICLNLNWQDTITIGLVEMSILIMYMLCD